MSKHVHETRLDETIPEQGVQLRADNPLSPTDGQFWYNSTEGAVKFRIGSNTYSFAFQGQTAGQTLFSTTVSDVTSLAGAVSAGVADTIYLREGTYDLTGIANPGLVIQKSVRFIGEKQKGATGAKVRIVTDATHVVSVAPANTTITNNNNVSVVNNSASVTLVGGTWATDLTGQYLFLDGQTYLILANPTNTTITLARAFTGATNTSKSYFVAAMIDGAGFENIEFFSQTTTHDAVLFNNVIRPSLFNCSFVAASDSIYGKVKEVVTINAIIDSCDFQNYKVNFLSDNYNGLIANNIFTTSVLMATDPALSLDTQKSTASIGTYFTIADNSHAGPGSFLKLVSANSNILIDNTGNSTSNLWMFVDSNSHNNTLVGNRSLVAAGGDVAIRVSSSGNILNSNNVTKATGFGIDLTATAKFNTVIGNRIHGGASFNDTITANQNRIEDDLSRIGQPASGFSKDFIDIINGILVTLQNVPVTLIQKSVAVNSGVATESPVFWNNLVNEYQLADSSDFSKDALAGIVKKTGTNSGDIYIAGFTEFTNSGNALVNPLFNSGFIGQNFYVGTSGQLVAESQLFTASGSVPTNPVLLGRLIDIPGGTKAQVIINISEDQKYATSSNQWRIGQSGSLEKSIIVAGSNTALTYSPTRGLWYAVYGGFSGEIVQPLNSKIKANSVFDYDSGVLLQATTSTVTISPHTSYIGGFKFRNGAPSTVAAFGAFSGSLFIFDHITSGSLISSGAIPNATFLGSIYNSGSAFLTSTLAPAYTGSATQRVVSNVITPPDANYFELARAHIPFVGSGTIDFLASASAVAFVQLQPVLPYQVARVKLQLNGSDIAGSEKVFSYSVVSGQVLYNSFTTQNIVSVFSATNAVHEVKFLGAYDLPASTTPVTFSGVSLILRGL